MDPGPGIPCFVDGHERPGEDQALRSAPSSARTVTRIMGNRNAPSYSASMSSLFVLLGLLLATYIVQSLITGTVYAKSGIWGRVFDRRDDPWHYWSAIVCYSLLSVFLLFWF